MLLEGNRLPEMYSYGNILPRNNLSCIFQFQLVLFAFSLILCDPLMVSPPEERGNVFLKILSMGEQIL